MKIVTINLYSFSELSKEAKQKAIYEHAMFLESIPVESEDDNGEMISEYFTYANDDEIVIESIEVNEYLFFNDGSLANCVTYTDKHPKSGITEFNFKGNVFIIN